MAIVMLPMLLAASALADPANHQKNITVMVVGDSWGSLGPSWHELVDMFARHNVTAKVRSAARGGTTACQWAEPDHGDAFTLAAHQLFPNESTTPGWTGPDMVWMTLGGNDLVDKGYQACQEKALLSANITAAKLCLVTITGKISNCLDKLLVSYWAKFPQSKVMQCGYDIPALDGRCIEEAMVRSPYCTHNKTCHTSLAEYWQTISISEFSKRYAGRPYTGLNVLGTVQMAGNVSGASVGHPVMGVGSPSKLMTECIHPSYKHNASEAEEGAGATAIGEAFWELFFSKHLNSTQP